jgi:hypothetical protein
LINPPNKPSLHWQLATAPIFFRELKERLKYTTIDGELLPTPNGKLRDIVTNPTTDWAAALMQSWSAVGEVLCFYQERFINEGYIETATEPQSLSLLEATLSGNFNLNTGFEASIPVCFSRFPGVAGSADLCVTIREGDGMPGIRTLAKHTVVQRVTPVGGPPLSFLSDEKIDIKSEWNALRICPPQPGPVSPVSGPSQGQLFSGALLKVKLGDLIAVLNSNDPVQGWSLKTVTGSRVAQKQKETTLSWKTAYQTGADQKIANDASAPMEYLHFTRKLRLFGAQAPSLSAQPLARKMDHIAGGGYETWTPENDTESKSNSKISSANTDLPVYPVNDILITRNATTYLATSNGVFYKRENEQHWIATKQGITKRNIQTLIEDNEGNIYAGTVNGGVYRSSGQSAAWSALPAGYIMQSGTFKNGASLKTSLPPTTVNKLALGETVILLEQGSKPPTSLFDQVFAATDNGLFQNDQSGVGWLNFPIDGSTTDKEQQKGVQPQSPVPVLDVAALCGSKQAYILIATDDDIRILPFIQKKKGKQNKPKPKTGGTKSADHGLKDLPNIFRQGFNLLTKSLSTPIKPVFGFLKMMWKALKACARLIKRFLEWISNVDPHRWSDINLPYPGTKIKYEGKFNGLQLFHTGGKIELALSTSKGLYRFDAKKGTLQTITAGLPDEITPPAKLTAVDNTSAYKGAGLLILLEHVLYGFLPGGRWAPIGEISKSIPSQDSPAYTPQIVGATDTAITTFRPVTFRKEWSDFALGNDDDSITKIDVEGVKGSVVIGSLGVLYDSDTNKAILFKVQCEDQFLRKDFGTQAIVNRLHIQSLYDTPSVQNFDRRTSKVLLNGQNVFPPSNVIPAVSIVSGKSLELEGIVSDLTGRKIAIWGPALRILPLPVDGLQKINFDAHGTPLTGPDGDPELPFHRPKSLIRTSSEAIFAMSESHLWLLKDGKWMSAQEGLANAHTNLKEIITGYGENLFLLTDDEIYHTQNNSIRPSWTTLSAPDLTVPFTCLFQSARFEDPAKEAPLLLGTAGAGLFVWKQDVKNWRHINWASLPAAAHITFLKEAADGSICVGTLGNGLFYVNSELTDWKKLNTPPPLKTAMQAAALNNSFIVTNDRGDLYRLALTKPTSPAFTPLFSTANSTPILCLTVEKEEVIAGLATGGLLRSIDGGNQWQSYSTGICSRIQAALPIKHQWMLACCLPSPGTTRAADSEQLPKKIVGSDIPAAPFADELNQGLLSQGLFDQFARVGIKPPQDPVLQTVKFNLSWILSSDLNLKPEPKTAPVYLIYRQEDHLKILTLKSDFPVTEYTPPSGNRGEEFIIQHQDGCLETLLPWPGQVLKRPASKDDKIQSQVFSVRSSENNPSSGSTRIELSEELRTALDGGKSTVMGNIVGVRQGQPIEREILGDGQSSEIFQSFKLKAGQLVFIQEQGQKVTPILQLFVDNQPYRLISDLAAAKEGDRVYVLTLDEKGHGTVIFGNGTNGCRLPSGTGNVTASYWVNMTPFDASDEKAKFVQTNPDYGVSSILVPVRQTAPLPAAPFERKVRPKDNPALLPRHVITTADLVKMAASLPDVAKSNLRKSLIQNRKVLTLTIAGHSPEKAVPDIKTCEQITHQINRLGLDPKMPLRVLPVTLRPFRVSVVLTIEAYADKKQCAAQIPDQARRIITENYGYRAMDIGEPITLHRIQNQLSQIPTIVDVKIKALHFTGLPPTRADLVAPRQGTETVGDSLIYLDEKKDAVVVDLGFENKSGFRPNTSPSSSDNREALL